MDDAYSLWMIFAAALGFGGFWLGRRVARLERPPLSRDYQLGLDHLLHGRVDTALKLLDDVATRDDDALELQFALASLFRKRGEVDRATGLHERLLVHAVESVRLRAQFELALDYLAAGLLDRAEQRLTTLAAAGPYREPAQLHMLRLYEMQSDWLAALRLHQELPEAARRGRAPIAAHYLCELADQALLTGELRRVADLLDEASRYDAASARISFLRARLAERSGNTEEARLQSERAALLRPAFATSLRESTAQLRCADCGFDSGSWLWRCPRCSAWDRFANRR